MRRFPARLWHRLVRFWDNLCAACELSAAHAYEGVALWAGSVGPRLASPRGPGNALAVSDGRIHPVQRYYPGARPLRLHRAAGRAGHRYR